MKGRSKDDFATALVEESTGTTNTPVSQQQDSDPQDWEERFQSLYEDSPVGVQLYDEEGRLLRANRSSLDLFGSPDVSVSGPPVCVRPSVRGPLA